MKKYIYLFLILGQTLFAQDNFDTANQLYQNEKYDAAIRRYQMVLSSGKTSAEVEFNLANSYYKTNKVGLAILHYERALLLNPGDADILNNLKFAEKMKIDDIKENRTVGFEKMFRELTGNYDYNQWAWISVVFAFLFLLCFAGYYFSGTTLLKRIFFVSMFIVFIAMALTILAAVFEKRYETNERPAIVYTEIANVKNEPRESANDAFTLHEGTKVMVLENTNGWSKIQLLDGTQGFLKSNTIAEIKQ